MDVYGKEYKVPGGMYRGEPPKEFFHRDWVKQEEQRQLNPDPATLNSAFVFPGVALSHLIGEVGASSVGRDENAAPSTWMSIDDPIGFILPEAKSRKSGVNANPVKEMYVFGKGGKENDFVTFSPMYFLIIVLLYFLLHLFSSNA